jgi:hypothetical protein
VSTAAAFFVVRLARVALVFTGAGVLLGWRDTREVTNLRVLPSSKEIVT